MKTVSAVGVVKRTRRKAGFEGRRSQAGIIFISDFVMKIKLHEIRLRYQFMKINFFCIDVGQVFGEVM